MMKKDRYRNNGLLAIIVESLQTKLNYKAMQELSETYLQYDAVCVSNLFGCSPNYDHAEETDGLEGSYNISLTTSFLRKIFK